ncbi:MAG: hypothetical protein CL610_20100 [Anaerolineaceae bacterium]|nr:hypothetical protein [Anaerolineaceae bacterium]
MGAYDNLQVYYGDIHNHCNIGYGHGSIEDAFRNARMQLDFACVTVHGHWGDLPDGEAHLAPIVDFHEMGFERTRAMWPQLVSAVNANHVPDEFVTFLGFEWHSLTYGDHCIYYKKPEGDVIRVRELEELRQELRRIQAAGNDCLLLPHHIGYKTGYRGANWDTYTPEFSPIVEIMSMHGASESAEAPYPYLHTMGPRDGNSLYQHALSQGHVVGVMGSTDHHSGHPGSYGHGRLAAWSTDLTRNGIWEAISQRRTVALTGDNIALKFGLNDAPLGSVLPYAEERVIDVDVVGGGSIDYVDVLHNNQVIHRWNGLQTPADGTPRCVKVHIEVGWAGKNQTIDWDAALEVCDGELVSVEPRFRGHEIVAPQDVEEESYAFSAWQRHSNRVMFQTQTWGNATTTTASTQGICLEIDCNERTTIEGSINGTPVKVDVTDLLVKPRSVYLGAFRTPACYFHRAVDVNRYTANFQLTHHGTGHQRDWYYVRVRQHNNQWAWSSPIWIEARA